MPGIDITENYIRVRQRDPLEFDESTFRTVELSPDKGISSVQGKLKDKSGEDDPMILQSVLFDPAKWSKTKIKEWLRAHNYKIDFAKADPQTDPIQSDNGDNWQEVFRAGVYPVQGTFTEADVLALASNYDPSKFKAPLIIIGGQHPDYDEQKNVNPVGFVTALKAEGKSLYAKFGEVVEGAKSLVKDNIIKGVSISFINKTRQLIHIALCTNTPQVKGLKPLSFNAQDMDGLVTVSFAELKQEGEKTMATANELMQSCIKLCNECAAADMTTADPELMKKCVEACNACAKACGGSADMADEPTDKPIPKEAAMSEREVALEAKVNELNRKIRETDAISFCKEKVAEGKLPPAMLNVGGIGGLVKALSSMPDGDAEMVSFTDGKKRTSSQFIKDFIETLPVNSAFSRQNKTAEEIKAAVELADAAEAEGYKAAETVEETKMVAFNQMVDETTAKNKDMSRADAMSFVMRTRPDLRPMVRIAKIAR